MGTYNQRQIFDCKFFRAYLGKPTQTEENEIKIGFVVSTKTHKRAVKRNRLKRLMRESVRLYIKNSNNFDTKYQSLIFVASAKLLNKSFKEVDSGINKIMSIITNA